MKFTKFEPLATMLLCATMSLSMLGCKTPETKAGGDGPQITSTATTQAAGEEKAVDRADRENDRGQTSGPDGDDRYEDDI